MTASIFLISRLLFVYINADISLKIQKINHLNIGIHADSSASQL